MDKITEQQVIEFINYLMNLQGKTLNDKEHEAVKGAWKGWSYDEIVKEMAYRGNSCSTNFLIKRMTKYVFPEISKSIRELFSKPTSWKVTKPNFCSTVEIYLPKCTQLGVSNLNLFR